MPSAKNLHHFNTNMVSLSFFHFHLSHATEISATFSTAAARNLDKQGVSGNCTENTEESEKRLEHFAICKILYKKQDTCC